MVPRHGHEKPLDGGFKTEANRKRFGEAAGLFASLLAAVVEMTLRSESCTITTPCSSVQVLDLPEKLQVQAESSTYSEGIFLIVLLSHLRRSFAPPPRVASCADRTRSFHLHSDAAAGPERQTRPAV